MTARLDLMIERLELCGLGFTGMDKKARSKAGIVRLHNISSRSEALFERNDRFNDSNKY